MKDALKITFLAALLVSVLTTTLKAYTAVASGSWSSAATWGGTSPGSTVTNQDIIIPSGITVMLDVDVTFSGLLNSFNVEGSLTSVNGDDVTITQGTLSGSGMIDIHTLAFSGLLTSSTFTGTLNLESLRNDGTPLSIAGVLNVADTLDLMSGTITLSTGANFTPQGSATIKVDDGSLAVNGGVFNSSTAYNVVYVGGSKTAGLEINSTSMNDIHVMLDGPSDVLSLNNNLRVNGTLYVHSGELDISGRELSLYGDLDMAAGTQITSSATSDITIQGTASLGTNLRFTPGSAVNDFQIGLAGPSNVGIVNDLDVNGMLTLSDGTLNLQSGSTLTMAAGSTIRVEEGAMALNGGTFVGAAAYNVEYTGGGAISGLELTGTGLNTLTLNLNSGNGQVSLNAATTTVNNLTLTAGKLNMNGNELIVNSTFNQASNTRIVGNEDSELELNLGAGSGMMLYMDDSNRNLGDMELNITGGGTLTLGTQLSIVDELSLASGKLDISDYDLTLQSAGVVTGYNENNYIVTSGAGRLQMRVNAAAPYLTFPVGTASNYSPASIQQNSSGTAGNFFVRVMDGVYTMGTTGTNLATTGGSIVNRTWDIASGAGMNIDMNLVLAWTSAAEVNGFDRSQAYISHYLGGSWDAYAAASASAGIHNTYEIGRMNINSLSPFAVVDTSVVLEAAEMVDAAQINFYPNPAEDVLYIDIANGVGAYTFEVLDLSGKTIIQSSAFRGPSALDLSNLARGCYLIKAVSVNEGKVLVKQFVKA